MREKQGAEKKLGEGDTATDKSKDCTHPYRGGDYRIAGYKDIQFI